MTEKHKQAPPQLDALIQVRCPQQMIATIKQTASDKGQTASAYVRAALMARLDQDGAQFTPTAA